MIASCLQRHVLPGHSTTGVEHNEQDDLTLVPLTSLLAAAEGSVPVVAAAEGAAKPRTPKVKAPQVPKVNKMAPKAKKEAASTGAVQIGIEYKKDVDFPKWYQQVI